MRYVWKEKRNKNEQRSRKYNTKRNAVMMQRNMSNESILKLILHESKVSFLEQILIG